MIAGISLHAQDTTAAGNDTVRLKLTDIDTTLFFKNDSLNLQLSYPIDHKIPKNIIPVPGTPRNPWEIDYRGSSYYTPRLVQDKMDQIMNRPRSDSFMPVLAMAFFAANLAAKQLQISKLFELTGEDYIISDNQWQILEALWQKAPLRIDQLYLDMNLKNKTTAAELQQQLSQLSDKNLIKTRDAGNDVILFYPAQDRNMVSKLINNELSQAADNDSLTVHLKRIQNRLQNLQIQKDN